MTKFQNQNYKFQTNYNDQNPKSQTAKVRVLNFEHWHLKFGAWCLKTINLT